MAEGFKLFQILIVIFQDLKITSSKKNLLNFKKKI